MDDDDIQAQLILAISYPLGDVFYIIRYLCIAWHRIQSDGHGGECGYLYNGRI